MHSNKRTYQKMRSHKSKLLCSSEKVIAERKEKATEDDWIIWGWWWLMINPLTSQTPVSLKAVTLSEPNYNQRKIKINFLLEQSHTFSTQTTYWTVNRQCTVVDYLTTETIQNLRKTLTMFRLSRVRTVWVKKDRISIIWREKWPHLLGEKSPWVYSCYNKRDNNWVIYIYYMIKGLPWKRHNLHHTCSYTYIIACMYA